MFGIMYSSTLTVRTERKGVLVTCAHNIVLLGARVMVVLRYMKGVLPIRYRCF